ncbi:MAG: hypothetical protein R3247_15965, partial [Rhodothermales bacterium]|nr:hypothetical protein [Rhodothermales bacterium]
MLRRALLVALGLLLAGAVRGQEAPPRGAEAETHMALAFAEGVRAIEGADYGRAIPRLIRLYHVDSTYASADLGSLAYWLGHAFARTGQPEMAAV